MRSFTVAIVGKKIARQRKSSLSQDGKKSRQDATGTTNLGMASLKKDIWANLQQIENAADKRAMKLKYDNYVQTEKYLLGLPGGKYERW